MIIILDDIIDLKSNFQRDSMTVLDQLKQPNINEKWYSLDEQHPFENFCNSMIGIANQFINLDSCVGYEFWTQKNTRPSKWHQDKDEQLNGNKSILSFPLCSMVYYLIVENLEGGQLHVEDDIITPKTNRLVIFSPGKNHYVQPYTGTRISMLVNPWDRVLNKSN
tara:strand:+ start:59 stop:553 length:495 start_codon:yes stop_codon:yes gene_type:complete